MPCNYLCLSFCILQHEVLEKWSINDIFVFLLAGYYFTFLLLSEMVDLQSDCTTYHNIWLTITRKMWNYVVVRLVPRPLLAFQHFMTKAGGPGTQWYVSDISPGIDTIVCSREFYFLAINDYFKFT